MYPSKKTRIFLLFILLGLFLGQFAIITSSVILVFLVSILILFPKKNFIFWGFIIFSISGLYSIFYAQYIEKYRINLLPKEEIQIQAVVQNYGQKKDKKTLHHIKILKIELTKNKMEDKNHAKSRYRLNSSMSNYYSLAINDTSSIGFLLLEHYQKINLKPGEIITFSGKIKSIVNFNKFDYQRYLWQFRISGIVRPTSNIKITQKAHWIKKIPAQIRAHTEQNIKKILPNPHAQIATGMTIGVKEDFDKITALHIKNAGLQHLIVVSGSNVTLLILFLAFIFRRFGPYFFGGISAFFIILFWLTVGVDPPVNRAIIFGLITSFALIIGRKADSRNLILLTALLFAVLNPIILRDSVSFQLTFSATLGIILITPITYKYLKNKIPNQLSLLLSIVVSAQISVLPLIIFNFDTFPVSGFITNLIVEPLVPIIMMNTVLIGIFGEMPLVGEFLGFFAFYEVSMLLFIAQVFSQFGVIFIPKFIAILLFIIQFIFLVWAFFSPKYEKKFLHPFQSKLDF